MNKVYILAPLIGCLLFFGYYLKFNSQYEAEEEARKAAQVEKVKQKQIADELLRKAAYDAAIQAQKERTEQRERDAKIEEEKKKSRQDLEDKRERSFNERKKFREQVDRLKKEVAGVEEEIKKIEAEKKSHADEQAFLRSYVKQAESNVKYYYDLLDKIDAAEKARAEAERLAAAAAAKKS